MGDEFVKLPTCAGQLSSELQPFTTIALVRVTTAVATVLTDKIMTKSNSTAKSVGLPGDILIHWQGQ